MAKKKLLNMPSNNLAVFYCGTNGAGKSTLRSFNQDAVQIIIDSDHIAAQIHPAAPRSVDFEAEKEALKLFKFALEKRISFSMESTLSGHSIVQRIKKAKQYGFYVRLNYVGVADVELNVERVAARVAAGGHFIDEQTIRHRYEISRTNLPLVLPFCDEVFIYDNSDDKPKIIFWLHNKNLMQMETKLPKWCAMLKQELLDMGFISDLST
ncbi:MULTISPECIES: zeta toxin family protein [unclassified Neisseria]|uniref:zeta toxin family protein n=1 Tax=unclassified Neisseria TaxID=2623750 RepID=UPI002665B8BE|nr:MULTISPECIES: zeta toxin family protein [unclassified Neisseria]MDO1509317.1 zeta toxin family protein [Neisseria sp. MVDL19-042950]MDO1515404.1 zeta toxin family protein [Neisseria sp. MVDL18-041461]MDO1562764.1 zeta toxin family protein [Neisseria sp. MVDL20-010259]